MLIDFVIFGERNVTEWSREDYKIRRPYNRNTAHVECRNKSDTSNNRGNWNHLKIIQEIPAQYTQHEIR
jgi:hypothetical protein